MYQDNLELNHAFLRKFVQWFDQAKSQYHRIIIVVGGGKMSRYLVDQVNDFHSSEENLHRIGMAVTNVNAELLRTIVNSDSVSVPKTLGQALEMVVNDSPMHVITGGFKEGWSSDMDAAVLASIINADTVHKLSNIDFVYTADPRKNPEARPITDMTWNEYFKQFGIKPGMLQHEPGLSVPIGAFCANFCANKGISFMLSGGDRLSSDATLSEAMDIGSLVHP